MLVLSDTNDYNEVVNESYGDQFESEGREWE
jgi:hypothetical protein